MDRLITIARRVALAIVALSVVLYAGDYFSVRHRMAKKMAGDPLEVMKVQRTYVVPHKDGRAEIIFGDPETRTCVHSLFPQMGYTPCWYLKRQAQKPLVMSVLPRKLPPVARAFRIGPGRTPLRRNRFIEVAKNCYGADFGFWGTLAIRSLGVGICEASQPPPSASINWTLAVICCIRRFTAVCRLLSNVAWAVITFK